jgi:YegS/Rv2252/BmrU family lipid kinase
MRVAVIINPVSGAHGHPDVARQRVRLATELLSAAQREYEVHVTERSGHAYELAQSVIARGALLVVAWGGDGTMNEVGRAVAFSGATLGLIPAGSGNGLARELKVPMQPEQAFRTALSAPDQTIDVGEINGRFFFNAAGVGFDAHVAWLFNNRSRGRRGMLPYVTIASRELLTYHSPEYVVTADGETICSQALLIALANSRQYGNGAIIASAARLDDGRLDLVIVKERSSLATMWEARRLFSGTLERAPGVMSKQVTQVTIAAERPLRFHVDGEPVNEECTMLTARVHPRALRVKGLKNTKTVKSLAGE